MKSKRAVLTAVAAVVALPLLTACRETPPPPREVVRPVKMMVVGPPTAFGLTFATVLTMVIVPTLTATVYGLRKS